MADIKYTKLTTEEIEKEILSVRLTDIKLEEELCFALTEKAKLDNDDYALAFSYTFLGDYYLAIRDSEACCLYLRRSKVLCENKGYKDLLILTYRFIGMYFNYIFDEQTALDYYLKSLTLAEELQDIESISAAYNNIAYCFENKKNYKEAFHYYRLGYDLLEQKSECTTHYFKAIALTNLCNISYQNNDLENLKYYLDKFTNIPVEELYPNEKFMLVFCKCLYENVQNREDQFIKYVDELFELQKQLDEHLPVHEIYQYIAKIFLDAKNRAYARHCINSLIEINENEDAKARKEIQKLCIRYCQIFDLKEQLLQAYEDFYNIMMLIDDMDLDTRSAGLSAKLELYYAKEEKIDLIKQKAQLEALMNIDDLTNTHNRRCLNKRLSEDNPKDAYELAAAMLDIDFFKEYNDIYGHQMGDLALIEIGKSLISIANEDIHTYRYGGDEFTILFKNRSEDEVKECLSRLRKDIMTKNIEHKGNPVSGILSVSYGYYHTTADAMKLADMLKAADGELYKAKKRRNRAAA